MRGEVTAWLRALSPRERRDLWTFTGCVALAMAVCGVHGRWLAVPLVDDAAISVAYGQTLVAGHGLRLTPFSQVVEGFSNPLWTVLVGMAGALTGDRVGAASVLGTVLSVLSLPVFALWGAAARGRPRVEDALVAGLMAVSTPYVYWGASGMETGLHGFLLGLVGALALWKGRAATGAGTAVGLAAGLLCLTRPEGVLYVAAAGAVWVADRALRGVPPGRQERAIGVWVLGFLGAWLLGRLVYFDAWVPNTYVAKAQADFHVGAYLRSYGTAHRDATVAGALGAVLAGACGGASRRQAAMAAAMACAGVCFVIRFHGDWMRAWRFIAPVVPMGAQCVAAAVSGLRDRAAGWSSVSARRAVAGLAALAVGMTAAGEIHAARGAGDALRITPELPWSRVARISQGLRPHIAGLGLQHPRIAFPDMGGLGLTLRQAEVIDTGRLADVALARHIGNDAAAQDYLVNEVMPDYLDVHGPSGYLARYRKLLARYVPLRQVDPTVRVPARILVLAGLTPAEDPRCPGGRAAVTALSSESLAARMDAAVRAKQPREALALWRCAWAWQSPTALPGAAWRAAAVDRAVAGSEAMEAAGDLEDALRMASLATVLSGGDPRLRNRTESLREQVFPPSVGVAGR